MTAVDVEASNAMDQIATLKFIDCDAHMTEPEDLWSSRAPQSLKDRVPVMRTVEGYTQWYQDGKPWASTGGNSLRRGALKIPGQMRVQPFDEIDPAAWSVKERLALMDELGIYAQILYPNGVGFSSNHIFAIEDDRERTAILQMYNDFLCDVQSESMGRLFPQALLPIWDMDLTIHEMTRLLDRGIKGFTLSDRPELLGLPELPEPYFEPMWDLFNESRAVANFHVGAGMRREDTEARRTAHLRSAQESSTQTEDQPVPTVAEPYWREFGHQRRLAVTATQTFMSNVRIIANLCVSNLFDRYPNLQVVSAESGIGWVPFMLESLEFQFDEIVADSVEKGFANRRPTEYFRDHISVMFWFEETAPQLLIEKVGVDNVLVETDIPHPACLYPTTPQERFGQVLRDVDPYVRSRVLQDNAAELYSIPL